MGIRWSEAVERNQHNRRPGGILKDRCTGREDASVARGCYQLFGERKTDVLHRAREMLPGWLTAGGPFSAVC